MPWTCSICHLREATQKHHISYDPEIVIHVCVDCHGLLHNHGVGRAKGSSQQVQADETEHNIYLYRNLPIMHPYLPKEKMIEWKDQLERIINQFFLFKTETELQDYLLSRMTPEERLAFQRMAEELV